VLSLTFGDSGANATLVLRKGQAKKRRSAFSGQLSAKIKEAVGYRLKAVGDREKEPL
jgi:hypothetical protein